MGLFSFLKNAGAKLFGGKDKPVAPVTPQPADVKDASVQDALKTQKENLLKNVITSFGFPVSNLEIELHDDETAVVYGNVDTTAHKEKIILAIGNVDGIASVDDRMNVTNPEPEADFYQVQKGDSLSKIAKAFYGDAMKYPVIFEANKPMLTDPDLIYPDQTLRIPKI
ncbi:MAG: peptidoglycan-binding protein LysM [Saprospiraceae bacterium]|nr:peptidoglycan-binding protein LysM [Saprospiraceae bacterium]